MSWKLPALAAVLGAAFAPQIVQAQDPAPAAETQDVQKPAPAATPEPVAKSQGKGLLGDIRIGPSVAVGVPHLLTGALDIVYADLFSVSASAGRWGTELDETEIEIRNWDATFRFFPFQGSFFIGAAYGNQGIVGKLKTDIETTSSGVTLKVPTTLRLEVESNYLTPQLGWFARWDSGLTLGFDFGFQQPSGVKSELQTAFENVSAANEQAVRDSEDYKENKKDIEDAADALGKKGIPYVSFLRIGWLF